MRKLMSLSGCEGGAFRPNALVPRQGVWRGGRAADHPSGTWNEHLSSRPWAAKTEKRVTPKNAGCGVPEFGALLATAVDCRPAFRATPRAAFLARANSPYTDYMSSRQARAMRGVARPGMPAECHRRENSGGGYIPFAHGSSMGKELYTIFGNFR